MSTDISIQLKDIHEKHRHSGNLNTLREDRTTIAKNALMDSLQIRIR